MESMLSYAIIMVIVIMAMIPVVMYINTAVDEGRMSQTYTEDARMMGLIDSNIREVILEAPGSRRTIDVNAYGGTLSVMGSSDKVSMVLENMRLFSPGRTKEGNIDVVTGTYMTASEEDIDTNGTMDLVLENNAVLFAVQKLGSPASPVFINTSNIITKITNKRNNVTIVPVTGLFIDDVINSSYGYGYTQLSTISDSIPSSSIVLWLNSTSGMTYQAIFSLDAISDFVTLKMEYIK